MTDDNEPEIVTDIARATDTVFGIVRRGGKIVGYDESKWKPRASRGDASEEAGVQLWISGPAPRNEDGSKETCERLLSKLQAQGEDFTCLTEPKEQNEIDGILHRANGSVVNVQVVRAITDQTIWKDLHKSEDGQVTRDLSVNAAVEMIWASLAHKNDERLTGFILALDATDAPSLTLDDVIDGFNTLYGNHVDLTKFYQVWIVGPIDLLVRRLGA